MKKNLGIGCLTCILLAMTVSVFATPIPGSTNEQVNSDFETGQWGPWEHGSGLALGIDGPAHQYGVYCKGPQESLLLRQVVDLTLNPLWTMDKPQIDLVADVMCGWAEGDPGTPASTVSFRLDWWGPESNNSETAPTGLAEGGLSALMDYPFSQYESGIWRTVNPFNQVVLPIQPRWVSVKVLINQAPGETVWVDNLNLTAKSIPEPMSLMLGFMGLGSVVGLRRFVKK